MSDSRFFHNAGPASLQAVASLTGAVIGGNVGDTSSARFLDVASLDAATSEQVSFLDNVKYIDAFKASKAGACFVRPKFVDRAPKHMALLLTEQPYLAFAQTAARFYPPQAFTPAISPQAHIAKTASIGEGARIDAGAVIGEQVQVGKRSWIGANSVIADGVVIGDDCNIGALCSLSHTVMGNRVILHRGVHIGQDGFGFAPGPKGIVKVPQLGRVMIGDEVEIGSGSCIDRGAGPDTVIGSGSKIDNLVQIGHNVQLGRFVIIAAQCGISGSTVIDDGAMLGGQVGISGHVRIGAGAKISAQAGVMTDIPAGATYGGAPAIPIRDWHRQTVSVAKLAKKT